MSTSTANGLSSPAPGIPRMELVDVGGCTVLLWPRISFHDATNTPEFICARRFRTSWMYTPLRICLGTDTDQRWINLHEHTRAVGSVGTVDMLHIPSTQNPRPVAKNFILRCRLRWFQPLDAVRPFLYNQPGPTTRYPAPFDIV